MPKISDLPAAEVFNDLDEVAANQQGTTRRLTRLVLVTGLAEAIHTHPFADIESDAGAANTAIGLDNEGAPIAREAGNGLIRDDTSDRVDFGATSTTVATGNRGLPAGGTTGQVAKKQSGSDYDVAWEDESGGGGSAFDFVAQSGDFSSTPFDATANAGNEKRHRFTNTTGTQQVNIAAGIAEDRIFAIEPGPGVTLELIGAAGVTINGQTDRGGANPAIEVKGLTVLTVTDLNVVELSPGGITEGTQDVFQNTDFNGADVSNVGALSLDAASGAINAIDKVVSRPELQDYAETSATPSSSAGTLTLNLENGNVFESTLTENTTLAFSNPPASGKAGSATLIAKQDATGGRTLAFPASVIWAGGSAPTMSSAANAIDVFTFITRDGGTTWYGFTGGQAFS